MKVFKVKYDDTGGEDIWYQTLYLNKRIYKTETELYQAMDKLNFVGLPIRDWNPPEMWSQYPLHIAPDFWVGAFWGAFAVGAKAFGIRDLEIILVGAGQLLPMPYQDQTLTICNILECVDCIDENKSEWQMQAKTQKRLYPERPFFVPGQLPRSTLFKIHQHPSDIFTWEHHHEPECEFKACVEENKLTGLKFEPMWSDEEGIIPYKRPW